MLYDHPISARFASLAADAKIDLLNIQLIRTVAHFRSATTGSGTQEVATQMPWLHCIIGLSACVGWLENIFRAHLE